jgi:hypothetical protein
MDEIASSGQPDFPTCAIQFIIFCCISGQTIIAKAEIYLKIYLIAK